MSKKKKARHGLKVAANSAKAVAAVTDSTKQTVATESAEPASASGSLPDSVPESNQDQSKDSANQTPAESTVADRLDVPKSASPRSQSSSKISKPAAWLVCALFFLSGLSSLIYQVVWTRELVLVFGGTTFATSTVLAIFMGGLALGSFLAGRLADKIERPLFWYGALEGLIGIWALIAPTMFAAATPVYATIWQHTHASWIVLSLIRFVAAGLILLVPTTCMGATLPLLAKCVASSLDSIGRQVGRLYSINTCGAISGALIGGFLLLPTYGLSMATTIAAVVNVTLMAIVLMQKGGRLANTGAEPIVESTAELTIESTLESTAAPVPPIGLTQVARAVMITFAISGAIAMIYEVCWTRAILMVIGSSTYAFTVMLSTFLLGIFLGSLVLSKFADQLKSPIAWFATLQMMLGVLTLFSIQKFNEMPFLNLIINQWLPNSVTLNMLIRFLLAGVILIPITTCLGAIFPVVVKVCTSSLATVGKSVGTLYAANTVGAIIGAFGAGFVLLPLFGAENTLIWSAFANFLLGSVLLCMSEKKGGPAKYFAIIATCGFAIFNCLHLNAWNHNSIAVAQAERRHLPEGTHRTLVI